MIRRYLLLLSLFVAGCANMSEPPQALPPVSDQAPSPAAVQPVDQPPAPGVTAPVITVPIAQCPVCQVCQQCLPGTKPDTPPPAPPYNRAEWSALTGWSEDDLTQAWAGLLASCRAMRQPDTVAAWAPVCESARAMSAGAKPSNSQIRAFMENQLQPWQLVNADGTTEGLITGYYEPLIRGSRTRSKKFDVPVYGIPDDLIVVDFGDQYPELKNMRLRGRVEGRKLVPYLSRADIEKRTDNPADPLQTKVLLWAEDPIEFFFLQIQGSGQVLLPDGSRIRIAYADQNGHPYGSIGRWLIQKGELKLEQASMQGIQAWAKANPTRLSELLNVNPSYVFFREEAASTDGPKGALGVPLNGGRAIAVDARSIPLGAPVFLAVTLMDGKSVNRLVMAQDTGGAIRGRVRADLYWGFGAEAGAQAGRMRQQGRMWVLWPKGSVPNGQ